MSTNEVREKLGRPATVETDEEGHELWFYLERSENREPGFKLGGMNILFQDGQVVNVQPIKVRTSKY